ncbi:MAG: N-acetylmuramoyl-L-alanine amidase [Anaerolineaceae bacterium]|nr:N-acetylmuramoyl-L-alanine amidase [Anaerolineaceae bacterium]
MSEAPLLDIAKSLARVADDVRALAAQLSALNDATTPAPAPDGPPWVDVIAEMPTNSRATQPQASPGQWATRRADQIKGITIHHTLSHDRLALARYIIREKDLPTTEYTWWVDRDGLVLLCVPVELALWHDHTGYPNYNLSIGLAGSLHVAPPPARQIEGAAGLVAYLMRTYSIPLEEVQGHNDRYPTLCPGWDAAGWRATFFSELHRARSEYEG